MRTLTYWLALLTLLSFPLLVSGCADDPEAAGDPCDPDGEPCPDGMVCKDDGSGDEDICQVPQGGRCDPNASEAYCVDDLSCEPDSEGHGVCGKPEGSECDPNADDPYCAGNLVCAELAAGGYECHQPLLLTGMVFDASTEAAIEGAHVLALDDQATAVTDVAISDVDGNYELNLAVPRDADGAPEQAIFTLRASAQDYQTFPSGLRTALPISTTEAGAEETGWIIQTAVTDIALLPLPEDEQGMMSISGAVLAGDSSGGVLVVAEGGAIGLTAISDLGGLYTIFNVPDGSHTVRGYAAGVQLEPVEVAMDGADLTGVDLVESSAALGTVSGNIQIVNPPADPATSVVLVVESTFSDTFARGEVPRGLRTPLTGPPDVTGDFTIENVPAGDYVVLAAFENDDLVRDPDPNIAGTQIVHLTMPSPGEDVTIDESFKVTAALPVITPGADEPELVSSAPTLTWGDDSSEEYYTVVVYDAYGELVWEDDNVPSVSGEETVSVEYGGPLESGMVYQFRATSWRAPGGTPGPISMTEDLRGVFFVE